MPNLHRLLHMAFAALFVLAMSACTDAGLTAVAPEATLAGPTRTQTGFEAADGTVTDPGNEPIRVTFEPDGEVGGQSITNRFDGTYHAVANRRLSVETLETTLANPPEGSRYMEFYGALRAASAYAVRGEALRIAYGSEGQALRFARESARPE